MRSVLFIYLVLFVSFTLAAQRPSKVIDQIRASFARQLELHPEEKLYIQTDKPYYIVGEYVWFRAHRVDAVHHTPDGGLSPFVYVELINPLDSVVTRVKIKEDEGSFDGHLLLPEELPEGEYTLRGYTWPMIQNSEDAFFTKRLYIGAPLSGLYNINRTFIYEEGDRYCTVRLSVEDRLTQKTISPEKVYVWNENRERITLPPDNNDPGIYSYRYDTRRFNPKTLFVRFDYGKKYHSQYIPVPAAGNGYNVSFFPEGGILLGGVNSQVAFKALNSQGYGEWVKGIIEDEEGEVITEFRSEHLGMGAFRMVFEAGKQYTAFCENHAGEIRRFELPVAQDVGIRLEVAHRGEHLYVSVPKVNVSGSYYLAVHCRGNIVYCEPWDDSREYIVLEKSSIPAGVIHFILVNEQVVPVSERLVFNHNPKDIVEVVFTSSKELYGPREEVELSWKITDTDGNPLPGNFSVTITDDNEVSWNNHSPNILTTLLLTSDLKGHIENPGYYFSEKSREVQYKLDLLMLTQGWRRYEVSRILQGDYKQYDQVGLLSDQYITGLVKDNGFNKKPMKHFPVKLSSFDPFIFGEVQTDDQGRFYFPLSEVPDSISFVLQAGTQKDNSKIVLNHDNPTFPDAISLSSGLYATGHGLSAEAGNSGNDEPASIIEDKLADYMRKAELKYAMENGMRIIHLPEVEVKAKFIPKEMVNAKERLSLFSDFKTYDELKSFGNKVEDVLNSMSGVNIMPNMAKLLGKEGNDREDDLRILVRGEDAYIVIDGSPASPDILNSIPVDDIESIEVLKGADAIMFGLQAGASPVISARTKYGSDFKPEEIVLTNLLHIQPLGYQVKKEFYSPVYEVTNPLQIKETDLRTTMYWNPKINPVTSIKFFTSDASGTYSVFIKGVSDGGKIITDNRQLKVK